MSTPTVRELNKDELRDIIAEVLDVEVAEVGDTTSFINDLEVDSLMALEIVVVLERRYGVKLAEEEMRRISCLDIAYELISTKLDRG